MHADRKRSRKVSTRWWVTTAVSLGSLWNALQSFNWGGEKTRLLFRFMETAASLKTACWNQFWILSFTWKTIQTTNKQSKLPRVKICPANYNPSPEAFSKKGQCCHTKVSWLMLRPAQNALAQRFARWMCKASKSKRLGLIFTVCLFTFW